MFNWENWLSSCGNCNDEKWTEFPETKGTPVLLNPVLDVLPSHIDFKGYIIVGLTSRGAGTIRLVHLDRHELDRARGAWLSNIDAILLLTQSLDVDTRNVSREFLIWAMQDDAPYAAMTRRYLTKLCPLLAAPQVPHQPVDGVNIRRRLALIVFKIQNAFMNIQ